MKPDENEIYKEQSNEKIEQMADEKNKLAMNGVDRFLIIKNYIYFLILMP